MLTIHRHITEEDVKKYCAIWDTKKMFLSYKAFNEVSKTGHIHSHLVILLSKRSKLTAKKKWAKARELFGNYNLEPISTDEHFLNCVLYDNAKKKEGEVKDLVCDTIGDWKPKVEFHDKVIEFIQTADKWYDVITDKEFSKYVASRMTWAREVFNLRPSALFEWSQGVALSWQTEMIALARSDLDTRDIHWVYDPKGGHGKTDLVNYLVSHDDAFVCEGGSHKDIAYAYQGEPLVLFDLTRSRAEFIPYGTMEAFTSGRMFSGKYMSCNKFFKKPKIFVFSNDEPDESKFSLDRWRLFDLNDFSYTERPNRKRTEHRTRLSEEIAKAKKTQKKLTGCPHNVKAPPEKMRKEENLDEPSLDIWGSTDPSPQFLSAFKQNYFISVEEQNAICPQVPSASPSNAKDTS